MAVYNKAASVTLRSTIMDIASHDSPVDVWLVTALFFIYGSGDM